MARKGSRRSLVGGTGRLNNTTPQPAVMAGGLTNGQLRADPVPVTGGADAGLVGTISEAQPETVLSVLQELRDAALFCATRLANCESMLCMIAEELTESDIELDETGFDTVGGHA